MDYKNREWLFDKYVNEELTSAEIAEICGVGDQTILNWLHKFEIPVRPSGVRGKNKRKKIYYNTCLNCGKQFPVDMPCKHDPNNKRKFVRCCSKECTSELKRINIKKLHEQGAFDNHHKNQTGTFRRTIDKETLVRLYCYEHKLLAEIAKELKVKYQVLQREMKRHNIKNIFYRKCPQCGEIYGCPNRSMVDHESNKFKKYCSRKCFLSSRNQTDTWIELEVENFLKKNNIPYVKQFEVDRLTLDFLIKETNLVIEANGDFWHANPDIYGKTKPLHKIHPRVIRKDKAKMEQLKRLGYDVVIVWENDLKQNKEATLKWLLHEIKTRFPA